MVCYFRCKKKYFLNYNSFLYSYENELLDNVIRIGHLRLFKSSNLCYRYIDGFIVFNNNRFSDYLSEVHPNQLTVEKAKKSVQLLSDNHGRQWWLNFDHSL